MSIDSGSKTKVYWQIATERWKAALIDALPAPLPLIKVCGLNLTLPQGSRGSWLKTIQNCLKLRNTRFLLL